MAGGVLNFTYPIREKSIGGFVIDAFLVESYNYENRVTNLTVEDGSIISENVVEEPDRLDKERWRQLYIMNGGTYPTREEFFMQWGHYP